MAAATVAIATDSPHLKYYISNIKNRANAIPNKVTDLRILLSGTIL